MVESGTVEDIKKRLHSMRLSRRTKRFYHLPFEIFHIGCRKYSIQNTDFFDRSLSVKSCRYLCCFMAATSCKPPYLSGISHCLDWGTKRNSGLISQSRRMKARLYSAARRLFFFCRRAADQFFGITIFRLFL